MSKGYAILLLESVCILQGYIRPYLVSKGKPKGYMVTTRSVGLPKGYKGMLL